jgi:hypothetical protein
MPAEQSVSDVNDSVTVSLAVQRLTKNLGPIPATAYPEMYADIEKVVKEVVRLNHALIKIHLLIRPALGCVKAAQEKLEAAVNNA